MSSSAIDLVKQEILIVSSNSESFLPDDFQAQQAHPGAEELQQLTECLIHGRFEQVFQNDSVKSILCVKEFEQALSESKLGDLLSRILQNYLDGSSEEDAVHRKRCLFMIGVASLQLFIQNNWTGPTNTLHLLHCMTVSGGGDACSKELLQQARDSALDELSPHDCNIYPLVSTPEFLLLAKCVIVDLLKDTSGCVTGTWWAVRCLWIWQQVLDERAPPIYDQIIPLIQKVSANDVLMCKERHPDLCLTFHLECSHILHYYYDYKASRDHLQSAEKMAGMKVSLTGALGKKTKFQRTNLAQLILKVEKENESESGATQVSDEETCKPVVGLPKDLALDDDTLLNAVKLQNQEEGHIPSLSPVEQAIVMTLGVDEKRNSPKHNLLGEEILAYVTTVLHKPQTWCVHMTALMLRCQLEMDRRRTVERALMQMQSLVDQWKDETCPISDRLKLFYATSLPTKWEMEKLLASLFLSLGSTSAALEVYLRLHLWEDAISCYKRLDKLDKAERLIREQLEIKETALMLCLLGDVTEDAQHYNKAWEVSGQRSSRAMKSLGLLYVHKKEYEKAIECLEKSIEKNFLQYTAWFLLGYAAIQAQQYAVAARAYQRCVMLEPDNSQAWNNLSTSFINLKDKPKAFRTLQEALRCDYENWKIWENFMWTSIDLGEFWEGIKAYNRLMELKDKYVDETVLEVLVKAVNSDGSVLDRHGKPASDFKKKIAELFGHLTSRVTNNAQVWNLYAQLHGNGESDDPQANDKALQYLQKAHRLKIQSSDWVKEIEDCKTVMEQSLHLAQVYLRCSSSKTNTGEAIQILSSAKLMLKSNCSKIKTQQQDMLVYTSDWSQLTEPLGEMDTMLQTVTDKIAQLKGQS